MFFALPSSVSVGVGPPFPLSLFGRFDAAEDGPLSFLFSPPAFSSVTECGCLRFSGTFAACGVAVSFLTSVLDTFFSVLALLVSFLALVLGNLLSVATDSTLLVSFFIVVIGTLLSVLTLPVLLLDLPGVPLLGCKAGRNAVVRPPMVSNVILCPSSVCALPVFPLSHYLH
jgi:hypothetical protein